MTDRTTFSPVAAGLWRLPKWGLTAPELARWTAEVADLGVTTIDLADIYGGYTVEESFGDALREAPGLRERLLLVTKCDIKLVNERRPAHRRHVYDTSAEHIIASAENSLKVLGTDRLDVLLLHRQDPLMDPDEVATAFASLRDQGKVLAFGVSNFTPSHLSMLQSRLPEPLVTNQIEASALRLEPFEDGTLDQALERRMAPMAWSPLGGGRLFGHSGEREGRVRAALEKVGEEIGLGVAGAAFAFLARHPSGIVPVTGTQVVERVAEAHRAMAVGLSREQFFGIWTASKGSGLP
ncbi:Oxidoreductase YdhF [Planctomycetes bacterium Poly30]|uniref:Oxidoreductase YdhF n=1 Tax=Saltatorellus ferox TaxID=2528018 RepID=A0A518EZ82_9BACT|nr:Oxidoreductase YdhF [Planctomycetes bacterium Poly30]